MKILVAHCAWLPERKRTLARLLAELEGADVEVFASCRPEHAAIWARRVWERAEDVKGPVCILNDDVFTCPEFVKVVDVVAEVAAGKSISLHTSVPEAATTAGRWLRSYWYTGPGVILPEGRATSLLEFWNALPWSFNATPGHNEDVVAIHEAWARQEPYWSTIPALVRHDVHTKSSLGYDNAKLRTSCVPVERFPEARLTDPDWWREGAERPPFVENPWMPTSKLNAMRKGITAQAGTYCQVCWIGQTLVGLNGLTLCGGCLARGVMPVLQNARMA